jgi:Fe-S cluster assembly protein SufD
VSWQALFEAGAEEGARINELRNGPLWLTRFRRKAFDRFKELGLPTTRWEEWRETDISPVAEIDLNHNASEPADWNNGRLEALPLAEFGCDRLVFIDGRYAAHLSSPPLNSAKAWIGNLGAILTHAPEAVEPHLARYAAHEGQPFTALNGSLFEDGAIVIVPEGVGLDTPLHILNIATSEACHPRNLIVLRDGARATIVESFLDDGSGGRRRLTNGVTEISLGEHAELSHHRIAGESAGSLHIGRLAVRQERASRLSTTNVLLGAGLTRIDSSSVLGGRDAEAVMNGLYLADGDCHADNHTVIDHAAPGCRSSELYKGILAGRSRAVFSGRVIVRPDSQQTSAMQSNPNLLLNDGPTVHTRPRLEIEADDVRCTHGATAGHIEKDAIFYLRSRGLDEKHARRLLAYGFAGEILEGIELPELRWKLERAVRSAIERAERV